MANELVNIEMLILNNDKVKAWVENKIKEVGHLTIKKVEVLPETDIDPLCIYFVPAKKAGTYDEYMYIDEKWELIGSSDVDLEDYYKKSETDDAIDAAVGEHNESESAHSDIRELIQDNADAVGDLSTLKTTAKDSAVDAVNSVYDKQTKSITMSEDGVNMVFTKNDDTTVEFPLRSVIDETELLGLADVDADDITGGQYLKYDAENNKFVPESIDNESQYNASKAYTDEEIKKVVDSKGEADGIASLDANGRIPSSQLPTSAREIVGYIDASVEHSLPDESGYESGNEIVITAEGYVMRSTAFTLPAGRLLNKLEINQANKLTEFGYAFTLYKGGVAVGAVKQFADDGVTLSDDTVVPIPNDEELSASSVPPTVKQDVKEGDSFMLINGHWILLSSTSGVESVNGKKGQVVVNELPVPSDRNKLLLSHRDDDRLEWIQVDKEEVGDVPFEGTRTEWDALTDEEKAKYKHVIFTDKDITAKGFLKGELVGTSLYITIQ